MGGFPEAKNVAEAQFDEAFSRIYREFKELSRQSSRWNSNRNALARDRFFVVGRVSCVYNLGMYSSQ